MRVETIITGATPTFAKEHVNNFDLKNLKTKMVKDIQYALDYIGYDLIEKWYFMALNPCLNYPIILWLWNIHTGEWR